MLCGDLAFNRFHCNLLCRMRRICWAYGLSRWLNVHLPRLQMEFFRFFQYLLPFLCTPPHHVHSSFFKHFAFSLFVISLWRDSGATKRRTWQDVWQMGYKSGGLCTAPGQLLSCPCSVPVLRLLAPGHLLPNYCPSSNQFPFHCRSSACEQ